MSLSTIQNKLEKRCPHVLISTNSTQMERQLLIMSFSIKAGGGIIAYVSEGNLIFSLGNIETRRSIILR